jgi:N-acetylglutamate synthase-like GNAT family acetyltransferase
MNVNEYRVRRATLEDLEALGALWRSMQYPVEELGRRVTEFQVAESSAGELVGAVGMRIVERQGLIHSESFGDFALADPLRPRLWERLQSLANNQGLLRVWTQERAPFWSHNGLVKPDAAALEALPAAWRELPGAWLTLKLREDIDKLASADKEFAIFMQAEKARTQRALQRAKVLKAAATLVALALLGLVIAGAFYLYRQNAALWHR